MELSALPVSSSPFASGKYCLVPSRSTSQRNLGNKRSSPLTACKRREMTKGPKIRRASILELWAILMYAFIVARMDNETERLWATILRIEYTPKIDMWNGLLEGYRDTHQVEQVLLTWDVMKKERL
ncbi:uncharacterized protein FOMMEDRAFT_159979 [Fomitiporia mediterranea MF3/22]|uniref:uncharacterized protein n=1 Tax=Fomitiporia mediterranea (strain MF3/22) TaxID=694068 RepID=UPI0004408D62|nr:uncharacterized protein FOMMEDRAFT_159979 [Fomitiporia mediterranea MF3/22]EJC99565.1 hypothetical protein FOMMEDRAFT_159979 [Fomitiporia mediterranea MF3/22]